MTATRPPKIGVALGAGAARGWAHIGVLQELEAIGVRPDVVAGCSSGALVGAAYVSGRLDGLGRFAEALSWRGMLRFFDISWRGGGLIEGRWLVDFFREHVADVPIEGLDIPFGVVATELSSGRETWLTEGSVIDSVRASIALPGLITPIQLDGRWLVDGALVNPLPVSLCRALGAEIILGVSMQGDLVRGRGPAIERAATPPAPPLAGALDGVQGPLVEAILPEPPPVSTASSWLRWVSGASKTTASVSAPPIGYPERLGYLDVLGDSLFIVQNFVSRVRLAADPVELLIAPDVSAIGVMDFYRGRDAIEQGRRAVDALAPEIVAICGAAPASEPATPAAAPEAPAPVK